MSKQTRKEENPLISIMLNVVIPVIILTQLSKRELLSPVWVLVCALILPVGYGLHTAVKERRTDFISLLGIVSVLLTGVFGILQLAPFWYAVKEAAVPLLIGIAIIVSLWTPCPLIKKILMSEKLFNVDLLHRKLRENNNEPIFEKRLAGLTWGLASSFFLSSVLNFFLARMFVKTHPATDMAAFNMEVGKMTGWSYVVIMIPSMAVMIAVLIALIKTLTHLTGLKMDDLLAEHLREENQKHKTPKDPVNSETSKPE